MQYRFLNECYGEKSFQEIVSRNIFRTDNSNYLIIENISNIKNALKGRVGGTMRWFSGMVLTVVFLTGCASRQADSLMGEKKVEIPETIKYSGGKGDSPEDAVVITGVKKQTDGIIAEYNYISNIHGEKNKSWSLNGQTILKEKDKFFDVIEIKLIDLNGEQRIYYFDVTTFPWKKHN